jgi:hypothetical protein
MLKLLTHFSPQYFRTVFPFRCLVRLKGEKLIISDPDWVRNPDCIGLANSYSDLGSVDIKCPDPDPEFELDLDPYKKRPNPPPPQKMLSKYYVSKSWMFSYRTGGFSCVLGILQGSLGRNTAKYFFPM